MAIRGIRGDKAIREKQVLQELSLVSQDFFRLMNDQVSELTAITEIEKDSSQSLVFVVRKEVESPIIVVGHRMMFLPDRYLDSTENHEITGDSELAWDMEYVRKDFKGALNYYKQLAVSATNSDVIKTAWFAQARILKKQKQYADALVCYDLIGTKFYSHRINGLPAGAIALMEIARIKLLSGDTAGTVRAIFQMADYLLHPPVNCGQDPMELLISDMADLRKSITPLAKESNVILKGTDSLISRLNPFLERSGYLSGILSTIDKYVAGVGNQNFYLPAKGYRDWLIIQEDSSLNKKCWMIDLNRLSESKFPAIIKKYDPGQIYSYRVTDQSGKLLYDRVLDTDRQFLSFSFPAGLPPWKLEIRKNPEPALAAFLQSGAGLPVIFLIMIAVWLITGLIFTVYTLNAEIKLSRMKTRFISNVSHEFKSPVTSIRHMSELLKLKRVRTEEKKDEFYDSMIDQCDHLTYLIGNILDFSRIEEEMKKFHFESVNLVDLIENIVAIYRNRLSESGLTVSFTKENAIPGIIADKDAIRQVASNLLDNACKYAAAGKRIDVNLTSDSSEVCLEIKDYGSGIPKSEQEKIFERFYRIDDSKNVGIKGSGIGLTLVRKIIESHHGRVELKSKMGEGSSFFVFIPLNN
jgi:signal transduction histidine kinase